MRLCGIVVVVLALSVITVLSEPEKKAEETGSLPDTLIQKVRDAKAFLRQRKSPNGLVGRQKKRGWEFEEEESFDWGEHEHGHRGHMRYPYRGHMRYPYRGHMHYPHRGHIRIPFRNPLRSRYRGYRH